VTSGLALGITSIALITGMTGAATFIRPLPPAAERLGSLAALLIAGWAFSNEPTAIARGIAGVGVAISSFLLFLTFMSKLPVRTPAASAGSKAPDFCATDAQGNAFRLSALRGSKVLLKFYQGTWCPYCVTELRDWNRLAPELRDLDMRIVAISHDSVEELRRFQEKNRLDITMIADPKLDVIRRYNLQNMNFSPKRGPFREMAVPASILIDPGGRVRWFEQAKDFRIRRMPQAVLATIRSVLDDEVKQTARDRSFQMEV
jgi:peroxiredoxin